VWCAADSRGASHLRRHARRNGDGIVSDRSSGGQAVRTGWQAAREGEAIQRASDWMRKAPIVFVPLFRLQINRPLSVTAKSIGALPSPVSAVRPSASSSSSVPSKWLPQVSPHRSICRGRRNDQHQPRASLTGTQCVRDGAVVWSAAPAVAQRSARTTDNSRRPPGSCE
jgi:hypothetical protein